MAGDLHPEDAFQFLDDRLHLRACDRAVQWFHLTDHPRPTRDPTSLVETRHPVPSLFDRGSKGFMSSTRT